MQLPSIPTDAGSITSLNNRIEVPFDIRRVYYLYDIPGGASRGGHAHYELHQYIIAASGSFDITIDDGDEKKRYSLNRPFEGLHISPGIWRELSNFSSGGICLVMASEIYLKEDYIYSYEDFLKWKKNE